MPPNLTQLRTALIRASSRGQEGLKIDILWLEGTLRNTIATIDWKAAAADVSACYPAEATSLDLWSDRFFVAKLQKMKAA